MSATSDAGRFTRTTAWARSFGTPMRDYLRTETGGAAVLAAAAVAALVWANVDAASYASVWGTELSIRLGDWSIAASLRHWVNDGLMAIFFLSSGWRRGASWTSASCASGGGCCCRRPRRSVGWARRSGCSSL